MGLTEWSRHPSPNDVRVLHDGPGAHTVETSGEVSINKLKVLLGVLQVDQGDVEGGAARTSAKEGEGREGSLERGKEAQVLSRSAA